MFFSLTVQYAVKEKTVLIISLITVLVILNLMFSCFLPGLSIPYFPKTWDTGKKDCLSSVVCTRQILDNSRKYVEGKVVKIHGQNILLYSFAASMIRQNSHPEFAFSIYVQPLFAGETQWNLHLWYFQLHRDFFLPTMTSFFVTTTLSLPTELTEAADFQSESIRVFYTHNFQSVIVNQFSVCFLELGSQIIYMPTVK